MVRPINFDPSKEPMDIRER